MEHICRENAPGSRRTDHRTHDWRTVDMVQAEMFEKVNKDHNETG